MAHRRGIILITSDKHGGFKLGLMNPDVILFDEDEEGNLSPYTPKPTASQTRIWEIYSKGIKAIGKLAGDDPILSFDIGDITHGGNHNKNALVSTRVADQFLIAQANEEPVLSLPNLVSQRFAAGTEIHGFDEASSEIIVANALKKHHPGADIQVVNHGLLTAFGVQIDYAHHGPPPGIRSWLHGNVARIYTQNIMLEEIMRGHIPPRVILRGHYHEFVCETVHVAVDDKDYWTTTIILPALCFPNPYARKATKSKYRFTVGTVALEVYNGKLADIHRFTRTFDLRRKETIL